MGYFVGADPERATVVFGRHTTDAVDLLAGSLALAPDSVEHHSNDLPWPASTWPADDPGHLDFVALSGHKAYAPFGSGALIGRRDAFLPRPHQPGGGTVRAVMADRVVWADLPDREEGGSPNVVGAVALAAAVTRLAAAGLDRIARHDQRLTAYAQDHLGQVPGVRLHGLAGAAAAASKVGVVPFTLDGLDPGLVAAVLGYEHGIGVRSGCFCAQPYIAHLLGLTPAEVVGAAATATYAQGPDGTWAPRRR